MRSPPKIFHNRPQSVMENITASLANVANESCLLKSYWQWHHIYNGFKCNHVGSGGVAQNVHMSGYLFVLQP